MLGSIAGDSFNFVSLLKACAKEKDLLRGSKGAESWVISSKVGCLKKTLLSAIP